MLSHFSRVQLFVILWTVASQAPPSMGILQPRIVEWVAKPSSRRIFPTQGSNPGLPHCRQNLYHLSHQVSPYLHIELTNKTYVILEHEEIFFLKSKKKKKGSHIYLPTCIPKEMSKMLGFLTLQQVSANPIFENHFD